MNEEEGVVIKTSPRLIIEFSIEREMNGTSKLFIVRIHPLNLIIFSRMLSEEFQWKRLNLSVSHFSCIVNFT